MWLAFAPFVIWRSTHYVFTTKRVLFREGVIKREERGIPLAKVNDVKSTQNLLERLLGWAPSPSSRPVSSNGRSVLDDIPRSSQVMNTLKDLAENDSDKRSLDEDELARGPRRNTARWRRPLAHRQQSL